MRKCWPMLWGQLHQVGVLRLRGREEIGRLEKYQRHRLDAVLLALAVGGLSQPQVVGWVRRFVGGMLSPATIGAVLEQAEQEVQQRRQQPLSPATSPVLVVEGVHMRYRRRANRAASRGRC